MPSESAPSAREFTTAMTDAFSLTRRGFILAAAGLVAGYFDSFPDQKAAAGQINALQSKYGPHLGGRRLTYARSGDGWRLRASGLTQAEAAQMCESVRKSGSACAIGAR